MIPIWRDPENDHIFFNFRSNLPQRLFRTLARTIRSNGKPYDLVLFGGATGPGKTWGLCSILLENAIMFDGYRAFALRENSTDLDATTHTTFVKIISSMPKGLIAHESHPSGVHEYKINNRFGGESWLIFRGIRGAKIDSAEFRLKSLEANQFGVDEATETAVENVDMLASRMGGRWKLRDGSIFPYENVLLSTNPGPGWIKDRFVLTKKERVSKAGVPYFDCYNGEYAFVPARIRDNEENLKPGAEDDLRRKWREDPGKIRILIDGDWDYFEGMIFPTFNRHKHTYHDGDSYESPGGPEDKFGCDRLMGPSPFARWFNSIDYGYGERGRTAILRHALDPDGTVWTTDEYYREIASFQNGDHEIKSEMKRRVWIGKGSGSPDDGGEAFTAPDPAIYKHPSPWGGYSQADALMMDDGDDCPPLKFMGCSNDVKSTFALINNALGINVRTGISKWMINSDRCPNLIKEMEEYQWDKNSIQGMKTKGKDHAIDAARYAFSCDVVRNRPIIPDDRQVVDIPFVFPWAPKLLLDKRNDDMSNQEFGEQTSQRSAPEPISFDSWYGKNSTFSLNNEDDGEEFY